MKILKLFLFVFISFSVSAQDSVKVENALLWEVSGNGLKQNSYIFGTVHLIPSDDYFFTDIMKQKFKECKVLALEVDINMSILDQINLTKKILLPDNKTLSDYMNNEEYQKFSSYILDTLQIKKSKWNQIIKLKPIFSTSIILNELLPKSETYEVELNKAAEKNGMYVIGLETIDYQIDVLSSMSIEDQVKMIIIGDMQQDLLKEFADLIKTYKEQNINAMLEMFYDDPAMLEYEEELLINRNANWIPVIEDKINKNAVFIAVGAMHLPGDQGVLNLLINKGYTLTPVNIYD